MNEFVPPGTTHVHTHKVYDSITHYRVTKVLHYNTAIDHPSECWQTFLKYESWFPTGNPRGEWCPTEPRFSNELVSV